MAKDSAVESNIIFEGVGRPDSPPVIHNNLVMEVGPKVTKLVEKITAETDPIVDKALKEQDKIDPSKAKPSLRP